MNRSHLFCFSLVFLLSNVACKIAYTEETGDRASRSTYSNEAAKWTNIDAELFAYTTMSRLAMSGRYRPSNISSNNSKSRGRFINDSICINNINFNGTRFGRFKCPLAGFEIEANKCCGSATDETQYCCIDAFNQFEDEHVTKVNFFNLILLIIAINCLCFGMRELAKMRYRMKLVRLESTTHQGSIQMGPLIMPRIPVNSIHLSTQPPFNLPPPQTAAKPDVNNDNNLPPPSYNEVIASMASSQQPNVQH